MSDMLPDYERHPLDETAMGVQFEPLNQFGVQNLFHYWSRIREKYPRIEEQPNLLHTVEKDKPEPSGQPPQLVISGPSVPVPMSRYWFLNESGIELIQVQVDRFLRNWRLRDGTEPYPRFDTLFAIFWQEWQDFEAFLKEERIGRPKVDQCDLTYVNYIAIDEISGGFSGMPNAFTVFQKHGPGFLPPPDIMKWESSYSLPEGRGRLHVVATPNLRQRDLRLVINFSLSARGKPLSTSDEHLIEWFQLAHEWIVRGFDALTTPEMHKIWGKK